MITWVALAYAAICVGVIGFQFCLIGGAPWGRITQGGQHEGPLPPSGRVIAGVSVFLLLAMALSVLSAAGIWPAWPRWTGWAAVGVQGVSTVLNWITPSAPERRLWGPITLVMLTLASSVVFLWPAG